MDQKLSSRFRSWLGSSSRSMFNYYHLKPVVKEIANVVVTANTQTSNAHSNSSPRSTHFKVTSC